MKFIKFASIILTVIIFVGWLDPFKDFVRSGNSDYSSGKFDDSMTNYNKADEYAPNTIDKKKLSFNKGDALYKKGDYDSAINHFKDALSTEDKDIQKKALFNIGNSYYKKGDIDNAIDAYRNALKIDPDYEKPKKNLEYLVQKKDQNDKDKNNQNDDKSSGDNQQNENSADNAKQDEKNNNAKNSGQEMNKDQIMNMLNNMKSKPVRRENGNGDERGTKMLDKSW